MLKRNFIPLFILVIIFLFVMKPDIVSEGVFNGLKIWINNMIPYLLPMSVLSNILLQYNFLYRLSEKLSYVSDKIFKSKYTFLHCFNHFIVNQYRRCKLFTSVNHPVAYGINFVQ
jgi:hypothetical protein